MKTHNKPLITVVGATSKQGRSVVLSLLESQRYRVRAITRTFDSTEAKDLVRQGAELVTASLELGQERSFVEAFRGSHGAFLMTPGIVPQANHAETIETGLGKMLADAAVEAGVKHIVFTSLENVDRITEGKKWVPHFTDKGRIEDYIRTLPITSTFIYMAFFYTNLLEYYPPHLEGDTLVFPIYLPEDFRAPFVDPLTATGPAVLEIFDHQEKYSGLSLPVIGDFISPREIVETFNRVTGIKAAYRSAFTRDELLKCFPSFANMGGFVDEAVGMVGYAVE
ncbi:MAG: NmrA/HSCARG family protein, partial [Proteobacteria bacterium]